MRQSRYGSHVISLASGALLATAGPPANLLPALWVGMAGLAWALEEEPRWPAFASRARVALTGARRGLAFGFAANLIALRFILVTITRFTPLPWAVGIVALALLAAFEGLRWMVAAIACETLVRARVPRPVAFAAGVYAGTFVPTMIPWTVAGGVSPWPAMVQLADVAGERGVVAIMALAAGLLAAGTRSFVDRTTRRRAVAYVAAAALIVAAQAGYGAVRLARVEAARDGAPTVRVAVLQPSVAASTRWEEDRAPAILGELTALTARAQETGAELVVWPEAAYPYRLVHGTRRDPGGARGIVGPGSHVPVITGLLLTGAEDGAAFNSVLLAAPDGTLSASYDKRHLLWFGETVPLADHMPWLRHVFARGLGLAPGDTEVALAAGAVRAAILVCYEDVLPAAGREAASVAPDLLVNVTNDAWFTGTQESELHLRMATLRSVELRRDMVRAVNGGVPSWVDAAGRVRARGPSDFAAIVDTRPALLDGAPTFYARFGDAPWALLALLLANLAVWRRAAKPTR
ncbi:MAG TPA: apolipoprotein N-acyltransferase [Gemmatimonadaceae bacterium]|nr:apolipoprotein N-acyltransferase [Gemmatimonadaceae bacterium]